MLARMVRRVFDKAYYDRFYRDPATRAVGPDDVRRLGAFVCSYLKHLDIEVQRVLDLGCGLGAWRRVLATHFPEAEYTGVEISHYLCETYGWEKGSVVDYDGEPADLVICQGVLQYLNAKQARRAIANLARLTDGALFLEALTREDWERNCSQATTDGDAHLREADWYRRELGKRFVACGGGVFVPRDGGTVLYELERMA